MRHRIAAGLAAAALSFTVLAGGQASHPTHSVKVEQARSSWSGHVDFARSSWSKALRARRARHHA